MPSAQLATVKIERRLDMTPEHFKIWLERPPDFPFRPGQYCTIGSGGIERPYSIVSAPREPLLELFIERIEPPLGQLTPLLHELGVGDSVTIRPRAKGTFQLRAGYRHHVLIATVTGIAPFVSMLREWIEDPTADTVFHVLDGASYVDEFCYDDELREMAQAHPSIRFLPTCSRPDDPRNAGWRGTAGRVNTIVPGYLADLGADPESTCLYACGHPEMIADVRLRCPAFEIAEERYWREPKPRGPGGSQPAARRRSTAHKSVVPLRT